MPQPISPLGSCGQSPASRAAVLGRILVFIPTYNERENVEAMCAELQKLALDADVFFIDDGSPDGTGALLDQIAARLSRMSVRHRNGKAGIGSAHLAAIEYAYDQGYSTLITMDCDFSHSPLDIPRLVAAAEKQGAEVVVGSRYLEPGSLPGWNVARRLLTRLGHVMTTSLLGLPEDASGAFRLYRLDRIPRELFSKVQSKSYSFFFESLFVLSRNGLRIAEVPIVLPARTYGHSKMTLTEAFRSVRTLLRLFRDSVQYPERFSIPRPLPPLSTQLTDPQNWDGYWGEQQVSSLYHVIASLYRQLVIKRHLDRVILAHFPPGSELLHAGCGSGQVDAHLQREMRLTAIDISPAALSRYVHNNPRVANVRHGSILELPFAGETFDGVYNLGVLEHFHPPELQRILQECRRVLRPRGKLVLFWPHRRATSVLVLKIVMRLVRLVRDTAAVHPPEVSLLSGRREAEARLAAAGFRLVEYSFGPRDFWVQAVVVGERL